MDPRFGLDVVKTKEKTRFPLSGIEARLLGRPARSLAAIPTDIPAPKQ